MFLRRRIHPHFRRRGLLVRLVPCGDDHASYCIPSTPVRIRSAAPPRQQASRATSRFQRLARSRAFASRTRRSPTVTSPMLAPRVQLVDLALGPRSPGRADGARDSERTRPSFGSRRRPRRHRPSARTAVIEGALPSAGLSKGYWIQRISLAIIPRLAGPQRDAPSPGGQTSCSVGFLRRASVAGPLLRKFVEPRRSATSAPIAAYLSDCVPSAVGAKSARRHERAFGSRIS
jgi:hypothetical protein